MDLIDLDTAAGILRALARRRHEVVTRLADQRLLCNPQAPAARLRWRAAHVEALRVLRLREQEIAAELRA